jgi:WD40 repeat protein/serine/threonine protein kinase
MVQEHPDLEQLRAFGLGQLDQESVTSAIAQHLESCEECCRRLRETPNDTLLTLLERGETPIHSLLGLSEQTGEFPLASGEAGALPTELVTHPRYRLVELLGAGGMGAVYKAEHLVMDRTVALKVISRHLTGKPPVVERFRREVKAAAKLVHPNIVHAYDAEQAGDSHFLVMEYVEGTTLAKLVQEKGPLPVAEAGEFIRQAALALQYAHERGMVHRDIKPQNLMVSGEGRRARDEEDKTMAEKGEARSDKDKSARSPLAPRPTPLIKILDFGLARFASEVTPEGEELAEAAASTPEGSVTSAGMVLGSADYIAPEQADDPHAADIRADIYGLGCTFYFLLTGQPPFPEGPVTQKLRAHREQAPTSVTTLRRDIPARLEPILDRMLAKEPARRYQTPAEVAQALATFLQEESGEEVAALPTISPPRRRKNRFLAGIAAGLLCALGLVAFFFGPTLIRIATNKGQLEIETEDADVQIQVLQGGALVRIIDPKTASQVDLTAGDYQLQLTDARADVELSKTTLTLRRGGTEIVKVRLIPNFVGEIRRIPFESGPIWTADISPDGRYCLANDGPAGPGRTTFIRLFDLHTGAVLREFRGGYVARFANDGRWIMHGTQLSREVFLVETLTGKEVRRFRHNLGHLHIAGVLPGGKRALATTRNAFQIWDLTTGTALHHFEGDMSKWEIAVSADGKHLLYSLEGKLPYHVLNLDTGKEEKAYQNLLDKSGLNFLRGGRQAVVDDGKQWTFYDVASGQELKKINLTGMLGADPIDKAVDPDYRRLLVAYKDHTVALWDTATGKELCRFKVQPGEVLNRHLAISADGRHAIGASENGVLYLWRLPGPAPPPAVTPAPRNANEVYRLDGHTGPVLSVAYSPCGRYVLSGGGLAPGRKDKTDDFSIRLWEAATGKEVRRFDGHTGKITRLAFSPDGRQFLSASADKTMRLWDVETGKEVRQFGGVSDPIWGADFTAEGDLIAGVDVRGNILSGLVKNAYFAQRQSWEMTPPEGGISSFALSGDGRAAYGTGAGIIRWWQVRGKMSESAFGHSDSRAPVRGLAFSPGGRFLLSVSADNTTRLWDMETGKEIRRLVTRTELADDSVWSVAFSPNGRRALTGGGDLWQSGKRGNDYRVRLYDVGRGREITNFAGHTDWVMSVAFSPDGRYAVSGSQDGTGRLWRLPDPPPEEPGEVRRFEGHADTVKAIAVSPDSKRLLAASGKEIRLFDLQTGRLLRRLLGHTDTVYGLTFSPDGKRALSSSLDQTRRLWDVDSGNELRSFPGTKGGWMYTAAIFSPDGKHVLAAGEKFSIHLWDVETGKEVKKFEGNGRWMVAAAFAPDGSRFLFSGFGGGLVPLVDVKTAKEIQVLTGHVHDVGVLAFTPDGKRVLTAGSDTTIRVWDIDSGKELKSYQADMDSGMPVSMWIRAWGFPAAFSPDGRLFLTGGIHKHIRVRDVETGKELHRFEGHEDLVHAMAFTPDGRYVVSASKDKTLRLWRLP